MLSRAGLELFRAILYLPALLSRPMPRLLLQEIAAGRTLPTQFGIALPRALWRYLRFALKGCAWPHLSRQSQRRIRIRVRHTHVLALYSKWNEAFGERYLSRLNAQLTRSESPRQDDERWRHDPSVVWTMIQAVATGLRTSDAANTKSVIVNHLICRSGISRHLVWRALRSHARSLKLRSRDNIGCVHKYEQ